MSDTSAICRGMITLHRLLVACDKRILLRCSFQLALPVFLETFAGNKGERQVEGAQCTRLGRLWNNVFLFTVSNFEIIRLFRIIFKLISVHIYLEVAV